MLESYTTTNPRLNLDLDLKQQVQLAVKLTWPTSNFLKKLDSNSRNHNAVKLPAAINARALLGAVAGLGAVASLRKLAMQQLHPQILVHRHSVSLLLLQPTTHVLTARKP